MKIALIVPGGVSNDMMHTIPALMWLVGRLATRHTVKVYVLHRAAAPLSNSCIRSGRATSGSSGRSPPGGSDGRTSYMSRAVSS